MSGTQPAAATNDQGTPSPSDIPQAARDDYREYQRRGGRFGWDHWWERYKDDYQ